MVTVLITSFLLIAAISYAFYRRQRAASEEDADHNLAPPPFSGLFGEADALDVSARGANDSRQAVTSEQRKALRERAAQGFKEALQEAHASGDAALYEGILDTLVEQADSDKKLLGLVSYVARNEGLHVNRKLAEAFIEAWKSSPDRSATAKMLHVSALADDAALYQRAIETALQFWQDGRISDLSAEEFRTLVESEYWLLSTVVRSSGAGFVLKQRLAGLRRELAAATERI
jgi:hypothetical protein